jgi:hypothetical protein
LDVKFASIPEALDELRAGKMLIVVDDEERAGFCREPPGLARNRRQFSNGEIFLAKLNQPDAAGQRRADDFHRAAAARLGPGGDEVEARLLELPHSVIVGGAHG